MAKYRKNDDGTYTYKDDWNNLLDSAGDLFSIGVNKAGGADIDTTEGQRAAQMGYDSEQWGKFFGGTGWYNLGGKDPAYNEGSYRDYLMNPNFNKGNLYKAVSDFGIDTNSDAYDSAIKGIFTDRVDSVPFGYNTADAGGIFDSMSKIPGSTFGGTYAALGAYNLMDINEGMANYAKNQANDPLNKDNLKPFITYGDSGFANPLAAKYGAIVNYGKVQTEKDEVTVLPDGGIVDSASKSFHKNMDSDEVTEYLPQGSIVFSNKVMVKKDKFKKDEDDIIASTVSNYKETEKPDLPTQFRVSDLFGSKKEMSAAELIKKVRDMFPIKETSDDETQPAKLMPIDIRTNEMNRMARMPYIAAIFDKVKDKMNITPTVEQNGGVEDDKPTKAPLGTILAATAIANLIGTEISQLIANKQKKKNEKILNEGLKKGQDFLNLGTGFSTAATLAQDPYIPAKEYGIQRALINQMPDSMPAYMYESLANQQSADASLRTRSLFENTTSFNKAANAAAAYDVNYLKARNDLMFNVANQNTALQQNKLNTKLNFEDKVASEKQNRTLGMIQNANAILSNLGNIGTNWANQNAGLQANYDMGKVGVGNAYAQTTMGNIQSVLQNLTSLAGFMKPSSVTNNINTSGITQSPTIGNAELNWRGDSTGNALRTDATSKMTFNSQQSLNTPTIPKSATPYMIQDPSLGTPDYGYTVPLEYRSNQASTPDLTPQIDTDYKSFTKRLSNLETKLGGKVPQDLLDRLIDGDISQDDSSLNMLRSFLFNPNELNSYTPSDLNKALAKIRKTYKVR